jgi:dipeptidyl aminopeptidase/acylaminoacyl peptidase
MKKYVLLWCAVAAISGWIGVEAAAGRAMTIDDLITALRVTEPALSPDGATVAYVRTVTNGQTGKRNADIWAVPADGSAAPKMLVGGDASETTPLFAPDGKRLAFVSTRAGAPQLFVAGTDGSDAKQITKLAMGVQTPVVYSPDGTRIAYVSDVYPDCPDDRLRQGSGEPAEAFAQAEACNARRAEEAEKNPVKVHHVKRLLFRHWSDWREQLRHHIFVTETESGRTTDVTPGDFDSPPFFNEDNGFSFSPDGKQIAFVSNREGGDAESWTTNHDVWIVPITGGTARKLTTTNKAADMQPVWTRDGRKIVTRAQRRPRFESDRWYLDVIDVASGQRQTIFETPDLSVENFKFTPDGASILFTAQDRGIVNVYSIGYPTGTPKVVAKGGAFAGLEVSRDFAVVGKNTMTAPTDLFRVNFTGETKQLTRENESWLKDVAFSQAESLTVPGAAGAQVQYWLIKPPHFDAAKKYPVVFLIHGGPQGAWEDAWSARWNPSLWAAQGWVIAAPNPRGSTGFGQTFVDEISQDWGGKVMVDINAVVDVVAKLPYVDSQRMGIAGASYGGYAVNWIIGHTNRFKAAVSHDGVYNLESMMGSTEELWFPEWEMGGVAWSAAARENIAKWSPHRFAPQIKTPTLVITNELDYRVPVDQGIQLFTALRRQNVPSEMLIFPDEGHWVLKALNSKYWHEQVFGWMKRWLEGTPAPTAER